MHKPFATAAATLALGLGVALAAPARAEVAVIDGSNLVQALETVRQLQQQYEQMLRTHEAIAHPTSAGVNSLGRQLNRDLFRNVLPPEAQALGRVLDGSTLGAGNLGAAAAGYLGRNYVYTPPGTDFTAQEMARNATSVAGAQAMASELYRSAATRVAVLQGIEAQLAEAPDAKAVADLQARLAAEQAYIQAQQVQAQSVAMWQQAQERNAEQRTQERQRQSIDQLIEAAKARGG